MASLSLNSAHAVEFRRILRRLEDALRSGVAIYAFVVAALALALVGLLEASRGWIESNHLAPLSKIFQAILEGTASAIIIYYLIDRRLSKIRAEINYDMMLIGKTNVLSAIFDVNLDTGTVAAWRRYILEQKLSVRLANLEMFFIQERRAENNGILVSFNLTEDIVALDNFDDEKTITLGPSETEAWRLKTLKIRHKTRPEESREYEEHGPRKQKYKLKVREGDFFTRESEFERYFTHAVVVDNHVFSDGAQKVIFSFYVDENLLSKENLLKNPIGLELPEEEDKSDWVLPVVQGSGRFPKTQFAVYRCNPKCVFLPHQGFSYRFVAEHPENRRPSRV